MDTYFFTFTPQSMNHHSEFYKYIESFPHLPIKRTNAELTQDVHTAIKTQFNFLDKNWAKRQIRLRECLKLDNRSHIQFCLDNKVGGTSIEQAARELGIYKSNKVSRHKNQQHIAHAENHDAHDHKH